MSARKRSGPGTQDAKYLVCYKHILEYIKDHSLTAGDRLPTEQRFTELLGVSRITVRRAIAELEAKGYITKVQGNGTFVAEPPSAGIFQTDIPLVIPGSSSGNVFNLLHGASEYLEGQGYRLSPCFGTGTPENERQIISKLAEDGAQCMLIHTISDEVNHDFYFKMEQQGIRFVFMGRQPPGVSGSYVHIDDIKGGYLAVSHLIAMGYRRIALLSRTPESEAYGLTLRLKGYRFALEEQGLPYDEELVRFVQWNEDFGTVLSQLMAASPDAIFCVNDVTAVDALCRFDAILPPGTSAPAIIGFDNSSILSELPFSLSTIEQSFYDMGYEAAKIACEILKNNGDYDIHKVLQPRLIIRGSTPKKDTVGFVEGQDLH